MSRVITPSGFRDQDLTMIMESWWRTWCVAELMAMHAIGQALVQQGRIEEGMSLLDEAMAGVIGGAGGDPLAVAQLSCMTMVVCGSCFDLERATQCGGRGPSRAVGM